MATKVINLGRVTEHPVIVFKDGTKTTVRIMPRRSVDLEDGATVDGNWKALYGASIMVRADAPKANPVQAVVPVQSSTPATATAPVVAESKED